MYIFAIKAMIVSFFVVLTYLIPIINFTFFVKPNKKFVAIFSVFFYTLNLILYYFNFKHYLFLMPVIIFIYLLIIYRNVSISIIIASFIWILILIADAMTGAVFMYGLSYSYAAISNNSIADVLSDVLICAFSFILSRIFRILLLKMFNKININLETLNELHVSVIFAIIVFIFAVYQTMINNFVSTWNDFMVLFYAFNLFGFFLFIVAIAYYCFTVLINDHKTKEYSQLKDYTNMIENMYSDLRSFKHDYLNILSTLEGYIKNENIAELKNYYYRDLLPGSNEIVNKDLSISLLSHIKINPLKALLSGKINTAHSQGINVTIEIMDDIDFINMHIIDICRIIGIFMDNAIEGSLLCDNKFIHVAVIKTDDDVIFNISNSCISSTPSIHKIYEKNFSTKGEGRGLGLANVKNIITRQYKNVLFNTTIKNCIFTQELIVHNE